MVVNKKGQRVGADLFVSTLENFVVESPAPADPFASELRLARDILAYRPGPEAGHRVRVRGVVTCSRVDGLMFVQDETSGVRVEIREKGLSVEPGSIVEVAGFARHPTLRTFGRAVGQDFDDTADLRAVERGRRPLLERKQPLESS